MKQRKDHYNTLGIPKDASAEQIKKARKKKAAELHPDLPGGDHEEMAAVNEAYDVLMNPERRRLYDTTGEDRQSKPIEVDARQIVMLAFQQAMSDKAPVILTAARKMILEKKKSANEMQQELEGERTKLEARRENVQVKTGDNLFQMVIDQQLRGLNSNIAAIIHAQEVYQAALTLLKDYTTSEKEPQPTVAEQMLNNINAHYRMYSFYTYQEMKERKG